VLLQRWRSIIIAGLFVVALHAHAGIAPARAIVAPGPSTQAAGSTEAALVEPFGVGDALEAAINPRTGAFTLELPIPGGRLRWDSRALAFDRFGLGPGWGVVGVPVMDLHGGVRVVLPDGRVGEMEAGSPSGLHGVAADEVVFERTPGMLAARPDGAAGEREYEYTLAELGGRRTFFSSDGDPVAAIGPAGDRADWVWAGGHRLVERVSELGVVNRWERASDGRVRISSHFGETDASRSVPDSGTTVLERDAGRLAAIVSPTGRRIAVGTTADGLLDRIESASGALTRPEWQTGPDGAASVRRVRVLDLADGREVLIREWAEAGVRSGDGVATTVTDGLTRVVSEYQSDRLARRTVVALTTRGQTVVRDQELTYSTTRSTSAGPGTARLLVDQPVTSTERWFTDGSSRSATTRYDHDRFGRITALTEPDGTVGETVYDDVLAAGADLPTGHPLLERRTTHDGFVEETRHTLDPRRIAPVVTETFAGRLGAALQRTARTEFTLHGDGSVAERREFPQGGEGVPRITRFDRAIDGPAGTVTTTETVAVGTPSEAATSETVELVTGAVVARTDELGRVERVQLDADGRPVHRVDLAGRETATAQLTVQTDGRNAVVETTPSGVVRSVDSDALGRLVRRSDNIADGAPRAGHVRVAEARDYPEPNIEVVTDAWGAATTTRRDTMGRVVDVTRPGGVVEAHRYDDAARTVTTGLTVTGDLAHAEATTTRQLDDRGEVVGETAWRLDGEPPADLERTLDGLGREVRIDDGLSVVSTGFDRFGNAVETSMVGQPNSAPVTAHRAYDGFGTSVEKTLVRDAESRSGGRRTLDARGRIVAETDQVGRVTTFELAPDGVVVREVAPYGQITLNTYDPVTRALVETVTTSPVGEPVHRAFDVDADTGAVRSTYDPRDRAATEITRTYDALGGLTSVTYPDGARIAHEYDEHGRRVATVDVSGAETRFDYDAAGRLTDVARHAGDGSALAAVAYTRDPLGRVVTIERGNGAVTVIDPTSLGQLASERTHGPDGDELSARSYRYDARGNVIARVDRAASPSSEESTSRRTDYRYDAADRLLGSVVRDGAGADAPVIRRTDYELTVAGDVARELVDSVAEGGEVRTTVREFEYAPTGELTSVTQDGHRSEQQFDDAGNLVRDIRGTTYRYDAHNRPVATDAAGQTTLTTYWADGRRAALAAGADEARFYWDDDTLINEAYRQDGVSRIAGYLLGERRHARTVGESRGDSGDSGDSGGAGGAGGGGGDASGDAVTYLVQDRHGSTAELLDDAGATVAAYAYSDYGTAEVDAAARRAAGARDPRIGDAARNPFQWAGEHTDPSGTQHLSTRTYAPTELRFTTRDTAALHNRYAFGDGNPVMNLDPTGRSPVPDWDEVMNEPWFKVMTTALAVALTIVGFLAINPLPPQAASILSYVIGHYGGIAGSVVQAVGTALMTVDAIDSLVESKFLSSEAGGIVRITGAVLTLGGGVLSGGFKMLRKVGNDDFQIMLDSNDLRMHDLEAQVGNLTKIFRATRGGAHPAVPSASASARLTGADGASGVFVGAY
jgi:RHS repeat-associated protein